MRWKMHGRQFLGQSDERHLTARERTHMGKGMQRAFAATALTRIEEGHCRVLEAVPPHGAGEATRGGLGSALALDEGEVRRTVDVLIRNGLVEAPRRGMLVRTDVGNAAVEMLAGRRGSGAAPVEPPIGNDAASPRM